MLKIVWASIDFPYCYICFSDGTVRRIDRRTMKISKKKEGKIC